MSAQTVASPRRRAATDETRAHERRADLDWLRTLIVLGIIPFHALVVFSAAYATIIRHPISSPLLPLVTTSLEGWGIPFIFLLSGAAAYFALQSRSAGAYAWERVLRLLVPAALVALTFTPLRAYFLLLVNPDLVRVSPTPISNPTRLQNLGAFFAQYWTTLFTTGSPIVVRNLLAHLWFVPRLLVVSVACLPLFLWLRTRWGRWIDRAAASPRLLAALLVAAGLIPAATVALLSPGWLYRLTIWFPLRDDWTALSLDLSLFMFGYLIYASAPLRAAVRDLGLVTLLAATGCWIVVFAVRLGGHVPASDFSLPSLAFACVQVFAIWLLTLAALGLAMRYLSTAPAWQMYLTTAAFPIFVLHLPLLTIAAYYLQALPLPWYVLAALITLVTAAASFVLYEYVMRRVGVLRFLFGLKPSRQVRQAGSS